MSIPLWVLIMGAALIIGVTAGLNPPPARSRINGRPGSQRGRSPPSTSLRLRLDATQCRLCARAVTRVLSAVPGVTDSHIDVGMGEAGIDYDPLVTTRSELVNAVRRAGFDVT